MTFHADVIFNHTFFLWVEIEKIQKVKTFIKNTNRSILFQFKPFCFVSHFLIFVSAFTDKFTMLFYRPCIKPGIQERGTERGEWGECYIPGNVAKHSGKCPQTFRGMSPNIPGNVLKYSGECRQTFRRMSQNIPGSILQTFFMLWIAKFNLY